MKKFIKSKKMWFAFITVFISGMIIGAVGVMAIACIGFKKFHSGPGMARMRILSYMTKELELTPEQKVEVEKIMTGMSTQFNELRKEQYPKYKEILTTAFSDIEKLLDEKQKVKFKELQEKMKKWHHGRRSSRFGERGKKSEDQENSDNESDKAETPEEE